MLADTFPDVLGFRLEQGVKILSDRGYAVVKTTNTQSPYQSSSNKGISQRIVKIKKLDSMTVELLVCCGI